MTFLEGQFRLLPEGSDELWATLHRLQPSGCVGAHFLDRIHTQVGQFALLGVAEDVLSGVDLWSISGQPLKLDLTVERLDIVANQSAAVRGQAVPDDQELAADGVFERLQELNDLRPLDRTVEEPEVQPPKLTPAISESCCQLKLYCSTGVSPFGAQVFTRVGRSLRPDSSTKTMVRPSRLAFFLAPASA